MAPHPLTTRSMPRRGLLGLFGAALFGCEPTKVSAPPGGPNLQRPVEAIPPDLQLTVRVAVRRLREAVGKEVVQQVQQQSQLSAPLSDPLVNWVLERSDAAWAAIRFGSDAAHTDNVLVVSGDFSDFAPNAELWQMPTDMGAGWQSWERRTKVLRAQPTRVYVFAGQLVIFASEAEIDAVERRLTRGVDVELIEPPEQGLVSLAASMPALARHLETSAPRAAELLAKGKAVTGHADLNHGTGASIELAFEFTAAEQAKRSATAAHVFLSALGEGSGAVAEIARGTHVEAVGETVALRMRLASETLAGLLFCAAGEQGCPG